MKSRLNSLLCALVGVGILTGCGATNLLPGAGTAPSAPEQPTNPSPATEATSSEPTTPQTLSTPSPTPSKPTSNGKTVGSVTWSLRSTSGYSETLDVAVGDIVSGDALKTVSLDYTVGEGERATSSSMPLTNICTIDPQKDAAVRVKVTGTSTTAGGFVTYLSYSIGARIAHSDTYKRPTSMSDSSRLEAAHVYTGGNFECADLSSYGGGANANWTTPRNAGGSPSGVGCGPKPRPVFHRDGARADVHCAPRPPDERFHRA